MSLAPRPSGADALDWLGAIGIARILALAEVQEFLNDLGRESDGMRSL